MKPRRAPSNCPVCGADVSPNAKACPECGACEKSGWGDDTDEDGLGLSDDEFDYDKFVADEFGGSPKPTGLSWFWWVAAIVVLLAFLLLMIPRWGAVL
jgi:hypothetical protein